MAKSLYPVDPHLTGIALAHQNMPSDYIADIVAPRQMVMREVFEWDELSSDEFYSIPDLRVGRLSRPSMVDFTASRKSSYTEDYFVDVPVPQKDEDNAEIYQDLRGRATEGAAELVRLSREKRVADIAFDLNTYLASQRVTLTGSDQFSDATSKPIDRISNCLDAMIVRANKMVFGQAGWTAFRRHPQIVEAILGTGAAQGMVNREAVAELFEVKEVVVGKGWLNTAKPGQNVSYSRLWGKHLALLHVNPLAQMTGTVMPTFMSTAQFGTLAARQIEDPDMGAKGGIRIRTGEMLRELVISQLCGYFLQNIAA